MITLKYNGWNFKAIYELLDFLDYRSNVRKLYVKTWT